MVVAVIASGTLVVLCLGMWALCRIAMVIRRFHRRQYYSNSSILKDLPSVTVCIPARNERHAMTQCLDTVLASKYPKLEIIVCDDSSVDGTSTLIKAFARDGVRFIEGTPPSKGWLGKNNALNILLGEASGTYVLFLDVDTILSPDSIGQLVAYARSTKASMVSVLPVRRDVWRESVIFAPLRYFWKLLFHSKQRPIAASSAWMVDRKRFLHEFGDFTRLKDQVEPEVAVATHFARQSEYRFLISYDLLGVSYEKKLSSQIETSIRLRFPALGYSYGKALLACLVLLCVVALPTIALLSEVAWLQGIAIITIAVLFLCHFLYLRIVWQRGALFGVIVLPIILLLDVALTTISMVKYATNTVMWKGRPVTPNAH